MPQACSRCPVPLGALDHVASPEERPPLGHGAISGAHAGAREQVVELWSRGQEQACWPSSGSPWVRALWTVVLRVPPAARIPARHVVPSAWGRRPSRAEPRQSRVSVIPVASQSPWVHSSLHREMFILGIFLSSFLPQH